MDLASLRQHFAIPHVLTFEEENGLIRANVTTPRATATIYLQGAHLTAWQPAGLQPVIFTSRKSEFAPGKPIRGGIPVVFPWFATDSKKDRIDGHPGPSHGFARVSDWALTLVLQTEHALDLSFELGPTNLSRSMGFDHFKLMLKFSLGRPLSMAMTVTNLDDKPLVFEDCFHTYFFITDIHETTVSGLETTSYIDKVDAFKEKPALHVPLTFNGKVDRVFNDTAGAITIRDAAGARRILLRKAGSNTTVVWTPWDTLPELAAWEWHEMLAVETANAGRDSVTLAPGASVTMESHISVEKGR